MKIKSKPSEPRTPDQPEKSGKLAETIQANKQWFHAIAQQSSDIILVVNREAVVLYENDAVERILGFKPEERIGEKVFDHAHPDDVGFLSDAFNLLFADENAPVQQREVRVQDIEGNWHIFEAGASHLKQKGIVEAVVVNLRDITDRKRVEEALQESEARLHEREERYRNILDNMEEVYYEIDLKGRMTFFNSTAVRKLGYSRNEMIGMNFRQYVEKESHQKVFDAFHKVFLTGEPVQGVDWEIISKTGVRMPVESSISLMRGLQGDPVGFRGIIRDVTERKRAEEKLHREEQRFRALADQSADIIVIVNRKGIIIYENNAIEKVLGYKPEERIGGGLFDLVHPDDLKYLTEIAIKIAKDINAPHLRSEMRIRHRDGDWRIFEVTGSSLINRGKIESGIVNLRDITERKLAEKALRDSEARYREREERYRNILDNMEEAYYEVDLKGNLTFFNAAAVMNLGYADNFMMGLNFREYVDDENANKVFEAYHKVFLTGSLSRESIGS